MFGFFSFFFFLLRIYKVSRSVRQTYRASPCNLKLHQVTLVVFQWRSVFRHIYISMVLWFFQAAHHTHEWMEEKLQTYFRMDTGCLNHNTSMKNCKFSLFTRSPSSYKETFFKSLTDHLNNTRYQIMMKCWKNDPDARPTFTELKNQLKEMETLHKVRILINMKGFFSRRTDWLRLS